MALGLLVAGCGANETGLNGEQVYQVMMIDEANDLLSEIEITDPESEILLYVYYNTTAVIDSADFAFEGKLTTPVGTINDQMVEEIRVHHRPVDGSDAMEMYGSFSKDAHMIAFVGWLSEDEFVLELELHDNGIRLGTVLLTQYEEPEEEEGEEE